MSTVTSEAITAARAAATAAAQFAGQAAASHAGQGCRLAALLTAFLLPAASSVVFERDEDALTAETTITLVAIRDDRGALLWYNSETGFASDPAALALGEAPHLDPGTLSDIGSQLKAAYDAHAGHFDTSGDGAAAMPAANLLVLPVAVLAGWTPPAAVPAGSQDRQQQLAEDTFNDRYARWDRAGKPAHPWRPLVPGATSCWQCGHPEGSAHHQATGQPAAGLAGARACPGCGTSCPSDDPDLISGHARDCDYVDGTGQEYDLTIKWSVTRWHISTARSSELAAAAGGLPFTDLTGRVLDPGDDDPDAGLPAFLDGLADASRDIGSDGWEISRIYDARQDQSRA